MTAINWLTAVSGDFSDAVRWAGGVVPGNSDDAILGVLGGGAYTATAQGHPVPDHRIRRHLAGGRIAYAERQQPKSRSRRHRRQQCPGAQQRRPDHHRNDGRRLDRAAEQRRHYEGQPEIIRRRDDYDD